MQTSCVVGIVAIGFLLSAGGGCKKVEPPPPPPPPPPVALPMPPPPPGNLQQTLMWSAGTGINTFVVNFTVSPCVGGTMQLTPSNGVASCPALPSANGELLYDGTITINGGIAMHVKSCSGCGTMTDSLQTMIWSMPGGGMNPFLINFTQSPCVGGTKTLTPTGGVASCAAAPPVNGVQLYNGTIEISGGIALHVKSCLGCSMMPGGNTRAE